ncbi:hypothetical protein [Burkholderia contaminans]|uniref:Uncharacterized protein n=1 Tax=Burkholderia contaminans TaxID=488447 RepID=A0A3N8QEF2_9BURK|nr:hypothetical protein [Burkholderia contaminans]RQT22184.1 hypothetical protein DF037_29230 [Burkholderia contaminans]
MEPTSFFAPNVSPLAVLGCGILTFAVAGGLAYLVGTISKAAGIAAGMVGLFGGLAIMLQLFLK